MYACRVRVRNECANVYTKSRAYLYIDITVAHYAYRCACSLTCTSARARAYDDSENTAARSDQWQCLHTSQATAIRNDEKRGSEMGRRERMIGRDDGSGGERMGLRRVIMNVCCRRLNLLIFSASICECVTSRIVFSTLPYLAMCQSVLNVLTYKRRGTTKILEDGLIGIIHESNMILINVQFDASWIHENDLK